MGILPLLLLTSQMATTARPESNWSQELYLSWSSTWVAGPKHLKPSFAAFPGTLAGSWIRSRAARIQISTLKEQASVTGSSSTLPTTRPISGHILGGKIWANSRFLFSPSAKTHIFLFLFGRQNYKREKEIHTHTGTHRVTEICHPLAHFPNGCNS